MIRRAPMALRIPHHMWYGSHHGSRADETTSPQAQRHRASHRGMGANGRQARHPARQRREPAAHRGRTQGIGRTAGSIEPRPGRQRRPAFRSRACNSTHKRQSAQDQAARQAAQAHRVTEVGALDVVGMLSGAGLLHMRIKWNRAATNPKIPQQHQCHARHSGRRAKRRNSPQHIAVSRRHALISVIVMLDAMTPPR